MWKKQEENGKINSIGIWHHLSSVFHIHPYHLSHASEHTSRSDIMTEKKVFSLLHFPSKWKCENNFHIFSRRSRERESWWSLSTVKFKQQRAAAVRMKTTSGPAEQCGHTNILQIVPICAIFKFHSVSRQLISTSVISSQQSSPRSWMCNAADLDEIQIDSRRWLQGLS